MKFSAVLSILLSASSCVEATLRGSKSTCRKGKSSDESSDDADSFTVYLANSDIEFFSLAQNPGAPFNPPPCDRIQTPFCTGDSLIFNGPVHESDSLATTVGTSAGSCVITKRSTGPLYACSSSNLMADGSSIAWQDVITDTASGTYSIVGGTGAFEGASGSLIVETVSNAPVIIQTQTFRFTN